MNNAQNVSDERLEAIANQLEEWGEAYSGHVSDTLTALRELQSLRAAPTPDAHSEVGVKALLMDAAPKDGSMLRLLVRFDGDSSVGAFEDADEGWTIGTNNLANTGEDEWEIVGWDWEQDTFRQARTAEPIGWLPFHFAAVVVKAEPVTITDEMVERAAKALVTSKGTNPTTLFQLNIFTGDEPFDHEDDAGRRFTYSWRKQVDHARAALTAALASKTEGER